MLNLTYMYYLRKKHSGNLLSKFTEHDINKLPEKCIKVLKYHNGVFGAISSVPNAFRTSFMN